MAKGIEILVYEIIFLLAKVYILWIINKVLSKYYKAKKTRVCQEEILIIEDMQDFLA